MNNTAPIAVLTEEQIQAVVSQSVLTALNNALPQAIRQATTKPYLTKSELMLLTGWSSRQVEYKKAKREIPFVRRGRLVLFPTQEVYAYLEEGRVPARKTVTP